MYSASPPTHSMPPSPAPRPRAGTLQSSFFQASQVTPRFQPGQGQGGSGRDDHHPSNVSGRCEHPCLGCDKKNLAIWFVYPLPSFSVCRVSQLERLCSALRCSDGSPTTLSRWEGGEWRCERQGWLMDRTVLAMPFFSCTVVLLILCFHPQVSHKQGGCAPNSLLSEWDANGLRSWEGCGAVHKFIEGTDRVDIYNLCNTHSKLSAWHVCVCVCVCVCVYVCVCKVASFVSDSLWRSGLKPGRLLCPW